MVDIISTLFLPSEHQDRTDTSKLSLSNFFLNRLSLQSYDSHRFENWNKALETVAVRPIGVGPGHYVGRTHFPESEFGLATHNLFLKVAVENGWIGFISFFGAILITVFCIFKSLKYSDKRQTIRIALFSALIGQLLNSAVVDSLHWRHLFILIGFCWCELAVRKKQTSNGSILTAERAGAEC